MREVVWRTLLEEGWFAAVAAGKRTLEQVRKRAEWLEKALIADSSEMMVKESQVWRPIVSPDAFSAAAWGTHPLMNLMSPNALYRQLFGDPDAVPEPPPAPPPPPELPVTFSDKPVHGYRTWNVHDEDRRRVMMKPLAVSAAREPEPFMPKLFAPRYQLRSPVQETVWDGPILRAEKPPAPYDPHNPEWHDRPDHSHGIYAHDHPDWLDYAGCCCDSGHGRSAIWRALGQVEGTDRVVVHERGWRAESVRIRALLLHPALMSRPEIVHDLGRTYDCLVTFNPVEWQKEEYHGHR